MLRTTMMALSPLLFFLFALTTLAGSLGILLAVFAIVGVIDTGVPVFITLLGLVRAWRCSRRNSCSQWGGTYWCFWRLLC